jgi:hypothetical protein
MAEIASSACGLLAMTLRGLRDTVESPEYIHASRVYAQVDPARAINGAGQSVEE